MTFTSQPGTYGARQPGRMVRWVNVITARLIRRSGKLGSSNALVLTTIGRKTGEERTTPVNWFPGPDGSWLVVASANGAAADPAWFLNLAANPERVRIELAGRSVEVRAEQLTGEPRDEAWRSITASNQQFAAYEAKTDRAIPVIRLTERAA
jgi:deazaflavin-dependent oxidoreductase (nitroreductase family)